MIHHLSIVIHLCSSILSFFEWERICACFLSFVPICIVVGNPTTKREVWVILTGLIPPYLCSCHKPGPGLPMSYVVVFAIYRFEVRGDCSFCWCLWSCWPSLFILSFHNIDSSFTSSYLLKKQLSFSFKHIFVDNLFCCQNYCSLLWTKLT